MGLRFRKRVKIAPGVHVNLGKRGASLSVGGRGASVNVSKRGTYANVGIPGTGISYREKIGGRSKRPQRVAYEKVNRAPAPDTSVNQLEVERYNAHVEMLTSVHRESAEAVGWTALANRSIDPTTDGPAVTEAKRQLAAYKPTWRDRLFNRVEARQRQLNEAITKAAEDDKRSLVKLRNEKELARRVLSGERSAWQEALDQSDPFEDIRALGSKVDVDLSSGEPVASLMIGDREVVPTVVKSLTSTGKLSVKNMAKKRYLLLYQDYVCSTAIRIARELFALLPADQVLIHVYDVSQADEPPIRGCILSVRIRRADLEGLDFEWIDCSDTIETFEHNMKYLKTKGFRVVEELV